MLWCATLPQHDDGYVFSVLGYSGSVVVSIN